MLINSLGLLSKIKKGKALCAFNFSTIEVAEAIVKTAANLSVPIIIQTSQGEASFLNPEIASSIATFLSQKYNLLLSLNLDHGQDLKMIEQCLKAGYTSIHIDGSDLPFGENVAITKKVVNLCQKRGASVEGEVGTVPGKSVLVQRKTEKLIMTDPKQAFQFAKETKVDFLAVSIGETHGLEETKLQFELLNKIVRLVKLPLVLHGGSGIPKKDLEKAISFGIRKINFNTELRLAWTEGLKKTLKSCPKEIVPYKILPASQEAVSKVVEEKIKTCSL